MGRPPKPTEQKRLAGNPGKRPLPEPATPLPAMLESPEAPEHLEGAGSAGWERIWRHARSWLTASDYDVVLLICEALDERTWLREMARTERDAKALAELRKLDAQLTTWLGLVGLTPADRTKLGLEVVKSESKLADLRARMAAQVAEPLRPGGTD